MTNTPLVSSRSYIRKALLLASGHCRTRRLILSAKWASEQLIGLYSLIDGKPESSISNVFGESLNSENFYDNHLAEYREVEMSNRETDLSCVADSFLDLREYARTSHLLRDESHPRLKFIAMYSTYLAGEQALEDRNRDLLAPVNRQKDNNLEFLGLNERLWGEVAGMLTTMSTLNNSSGMSNGGRMSNGGISELSPTRKRRMDDRDTQREHSSAWTANLPDSSLPASALATRPDPFLLYLYGLVLTNSLRFAEAKKMLVASISVYPFVWSAWKELAVIVSHQGGTASVVKELAPHVPPFMLKFFLIHLYIEFNIRPVSTTPQAIISSLSSLFPSSLSLAVTIVQDKYHSDDYDACEEIMQDIMDRDPYMIEYTDIYSNLLFVRHKMQKLGYLAKMVTDTDKYRPETCCVLGNYYSLSNNRPKAIIYFERALKLNRNFSQAWTLFGHEHIELKNVQSAISCYNKALIINPRDFKAHYGLGQAHELMGRMEQALHYFLKAKSFRPYDARMHVAVADIYARLNQHPLALKGYTSALATQETPMLPYTLSKIASSYLAMSRMKEAAYYYMLVCGSYMKDGEGHKRNGEMTRVETEAARWLAGYFRSIGCLEAAFKFAELIETTDEGEQIAREIRALVGSKDNALHPLPQFRA